MLKRNCPSGLYQHLFINNWICKRNAHAGLHSTYFCYFTSHTNYVSEKLLKVSVIPSVFFSSHSFFQQFCYRKLCYFSCYFWWMALTYKWAATLSTKDREQHIKNWEQWQELLAPSKHDTRHSRFLWISNINPFFLSLTTNHPTILCCANFLCIESN